MLVFEVEKRIIHRMGILLRSASYGGPAGMGRKMPCGGSVLQPFGGDAAG
jgi:hypothetical protein